MMPRKILVEVISALLVLLWIYAAISKISVYPVFKSQLAKSPYVSGSEDVVAWLLPTGELIIALLIIGGKTRIYGMYSSYFLMLLFTGYIYAIIHYSFFVPCSCGGILSKMKWEDHFIFNILFTSIALVGVFAIKPDNKQSKTID